MVESGEWAGIKGPGSGSKGPQGRGGKWRMGWKGPGSGSKGPQGHGGKWRMGWEGPKGAVPRCKVNFTHPYTDALSDF